MVKAKKEEVAEKTEAELVVETAVVETPEKEQKAKAGKRSAKAVKEQEAKVEKEERKQKAQDEPKEEEVTKSKKKVTRSRLERRGKNYRKAVQQIDKSKTYALADALGLIVKTSTVKFDASVELHINLNVDPRHADQNVRDTVVLPAGTGKTIKIAVFAEPNDATAAKKAGADVTGIDNILADLDKGVLDFDVLISTPALMPRLGKYAKVLGPKGLMPNPKSGTVTPDVARAVEEAKAGRVEYRVDSTGIIHLAVGKVSFGDKKLLDNAQAVIANLRSNKPASVKGTFIKSMHLTTTMGPSISIDLTAL